MRLSIFVFKIIVFLLLLLLSSLFIESRLKTDYPILDSMNSALQENENVIVYFGDSVISWVADYDKDKRNLGTMLNEGLAGYEVFRLSDGAYHLGLFEKFSEYICAAEIRPKLVVVPLNLRSFSAEWDTRPEYQFLKELNTIEVKMKGNLFSRLYLRISNMLRTENQSDEGTWKKSPVYYGDIERGIVRDYLMDQDPITEDDIRKAYIFRYLYSLKEDHRKLISLKGINNNLTNCNIQAVYYVSPVDFEGGEKYFGKEFSQIVKKNVEQIKKIGELNNFNINDFSDVLPGSFFDHPNSPNEHLNEKGRAALSEKLTSLVKEKIKVYEK